MQGNSFDNGKKASQSSMLINRDTVMVVTEHGSGGVKRLHDNATDDASQSEAKVLAVEEDGEESVSGGLINK